MPRYTENLTALILVEQHLLNAAVSLRTAEHRAGNGELRTQIREILQSLQETVELTQRAKRIMLKEWRSTVAEQVAA